MNVLEACMGSGSTTFPRISSYLRYLTLLALWGGANEQSSRLDAQIWKTMTFDQGPTQTVDEAHSLHMLNMLEISYNSHNHGYITEQKFISRLLK